VRRIPYGRNLDFLDRTSLEQSHKVFHYNTRTNYFTRTHAKSVSLLRFCNNFVIGSVLPQCSRILPCRYEKCVLPYFAYLKKNVCVSTSPLIFWRGLKSFHGCVCVSESVCVCVCVCACACACACACSRACACACVRPPKFM
jgi:hypothetical protein